jgi:hypothetical protein
MTTLISTFGGKNSHNGLDICFQPIAIFNFDTLEILDVAENYTIADEMVCDLYHKGVDARFDLLKFHADNMNSRSVVGMKMSEFQYFVENNKHPLLDKI